MVKKRKVKLTREQKDEMNKKAREYRQRQKEENTEAYQRKLQRERDSRLKKHERQIVDFGQRLMIEAHETGLQKGIERGWKDCCHLINFWIKLVDGPQCNVLKMKKKELNYIQRIRDTEAKIATLKLREEIRNRKQASTQTD